MASGDRSPALTMQNLTEYSNVTQPISSYIGRGGVPRHDLDGVTRRLLEENEAMLCEINRLTLQLNDAHTKVSALYAAFAERGRELDTMREMLGGDAVSSTDVSAKAVNHRKECNPSAAGKDRHVMNCKHECEGLERLAADVPCDTGTRHDDEGQKVLSQQIERLSKEITGLVPTVEHIANSLKRCVVTGGVPEERMLEDAQKELHTMRRATDTIRRVCAGEETRVKELLIQVQKGDLLAVPGDLAVAVRWMIVQAFEAGLESARGNLLTLVDVLKGCGIGDKVCGAGAVGDSKSASGKGREVPASGTSIRHMFRLLGMRVGVEPEL